MNIFLAVPFSSRIDENGEVTAHYRSELEQLLARLRADGHTVFCALEYTGWRSVGDNSLPADELQHDFEQILKSDIMFALLEERISAGVEIELGYAYAHDKTIRMFQIGRPAWSNIAISQLTSHPIETVRSVTDFGTRVLESL